MVESYVVSRFHHNSETEPAKNYGLQYYDDVIAYRATLRKSQEKHVLSTERTRTVFIKLIAPGCSGTETRRPKDKYLMHASWIIRVYLYEYHPSSLRHFLDTWSNKKWSSVWLRVILLMKIWNVNVKWSQWTLWKYWIPDNCLPYHRQLSGQMNKWIEEFILLLGHSLYSILSPV